MKTYDKKLVTNIEGQLSLCEARASCMTYYFAGSNPVCNVQSMKSPLQMNSLLSKLFCYITWLDATLEKFQTAPLRQIRLYLRNNSLAD